LGITPEQLTKYIAPTTVKPISADTSITTVLTPEQSQEAQSMGITTKQIARYVAAKPLKLNAATPSENHPVLDHVPDEEEWARLKGKTPPDPHKELKAKIPSRYHEYLPVFTKPGREQLPPH
jgi:hypothetical protein